MVYLALLIRRSNRNPDKKTISKSFLEIIKIIIISFVADFSCLALFVIGMFVVKNSSMDSVLRVTVAVGGSHMLVMIYAYEKLKMLPFIGKRKRMVTQKHLEISTESKTLRNSQTKKG